jgi:hypothetical protein
MLDLPAPTRRRAVAIAGAVAVVAAIWFTTTFVICAALRATFPFDLAWMESGMEAMVARLRAGESMYVEPSLAYVPFLYPPLYYVAVHGLERAIPSLIGLPALRLVSGAATIATALLVARLLRGRAANAVRWPLAALVVAAYGRFGFWHDMARVDSLFVLLLLGALAAFIDGRGWRSAALAGGLAGLAILAKQPAVPIFLLIAAWWRFRRRATTTRVALSLGVAAATVPLGLAALGELGNAWLRFYVWTVPSTHALELVHLFWSLRFFAGVLPVLFAACLPRRGSPEQPRPEVLWRDAFLITAAVMIVLRLKAGAATNFFLPLVPLGALVLAERLRDAPRLLVVATAAQLAILVYDPRPALPTSRDWSAAFDFVRALRETDGPVYLPQVPGYLRAAGKPPLAQITALTDLDRLRPDLLVELERRLARGDFTAAAPETHSAPNRALFGETIRRHYRPARAVAVGGPASRDGLGTVAGLYVWSPPAATVQNDSSAKPPPPRNAGGRVPRLNGMRRLFGLLGAAGSPVSGLARARTTPAGIGKSRTGWPFTAVRMKSSQIGTATCPPVTSCPTGLKSSRPTQTPHSRSGVKP